MSLEPSKIDLSGCTISRCLMHPIFVVGFKPLTKPPLELRHLKRTLEYKPMPLKHTYGIYTGKQTTLVLNFELYLFPGILFLFSL